MKAPKWLKFIIRKNPQPEPVLTMATCTECGWTGRIEDCDTEEDGDWETGYVTVHVCPVCDEGGIEYS